jgi:hypothetical protein
LDWTDLRVNTHQTGPATTDPVWTTPRQTDAVSVTNSDGESESYLFYRGVGSFSGPLRVATSLADNQLAITATTSDPDVAAISNAWLVDIHLTGMFYCSQRAGRIMVKQVAAGTATGGSIINMGSGGGSRAHRQLLAYDTTKGGIEAATRAMALDLAPWKIRVNTLVPGNITVENSLGGAIGPEAAQHTIPFGHPGSPADLGAAAVFLASDDALYITGQRLIVDGGMDAQLRSPGVDTKIDMGTFVVATGAVSGDGRLGGAGGLGPVLGAQGASEE